jgi:hypothetical protein
MTAKQLKHRRQYQRLWQIKHAKRIARQARLNRRKNKERFLKYERKYRKLHKNQISRRRKKYRKYALAYGRKYRKAHRKLLAKKAREYQQKNKLARAKHAREYYLRTKKHHALVARIYNKKNKIKLRKHQTKYTRERKHKNVIFKLTSSLRTRLYIALKHNSKVGSAVRDLGCTIEFFKKYISKKFYGKMTWKNWGPYWHLDHIVPLWKFDLTNRKQLLKAFHYTNYQPLTVKAHRSKSAKETSERSSCSR